MRVGLGERLVGRGFLVALMAITILPFVSILTTALHPSAGAASESSAAVASARRDARSSGASARRRARSTVRI